MERKAVSGMMLTLLLTSLLTLAFNVQLAKAEPLDLIPPLLRVEPKSSTASYIGQVFSIKITINDVDMNWELVGVGFVLKYNNTMLEVLDIADGPFMKQFACEDYFCVIVSEPGLIGVFILIFVGWCMHAWGNGTLATISFKTTAGPPAQCAL